MPAENVTESHVGTEPAAAAGEPVGLAEPAGAAGPAGPTAAAEPDEPIERVAALVAAEGAFARPVRAVLELLTERPYRLDELVRRTAVSRRGVQAVLAALGVDLVETGDGFTVRDGRGGAYREQFGYRRTGLVDPLEHAVAAHGPLLAEITGWVRDAPAARAALDHVPATPETVLRRALWLDATYDLDGAHLLCVGDHDLTSLAVTRLRPGVTVTVVDLDERLLGYLDERSGGAVRCRFADLRFGLPPSAEAVADLVFTDPPYTPEGIGLFLTRGVEGLRDPSRGRLLLAYGFGESQPTLGLKVQKAIGELDLVYEAVLPAFHRYAGAQAIGSAADMYVLRPTTRTVDKLARPDRTRIYTHGPQSLEGTTGGDPGAIDALRTAARAVAAGDAPKSPADSPLPTRGATPDKSSHPTPTISDDHPDGAAPLAVLIGLPATITPPTRPTTETPAQAVRPANEPPTPPASTTPTRPDTEPPPRHLRLGTVLTGGLPPSVTRHGTFTAAADLSADPGPWLARLLLAVSAAHLVVLLPARHPDLSDLAALAELTGHKYRLTGLPIPDGKHVLLHATRTAPPADPGEALVRRLVTRAHGKIGNVWRDGLARFTGRTKNEARAHIQAAAEHPDLLALTLLELPRARIAPLLAAVRASARS